MAGMTGEMNIITGMHNNALLMPTRALLVDQALVVRNGMVAIAHGEDWLSHARILGSAHGLNEGDQSWSRTRTNCGRAIPCGNDVHAATRAQRVTPPLYIALRFLGHRKRAFLLSLVASCSASPFSSAPRRKPRASRKISSTPPWGATARSFCAPAFNPSARAARSCQRIQRREATHRRYLEGITNAREIMRVSRQFSNVAACSPVLRGTLSARAGFENATVDLFGIDLDAASANNRSRSGIDGRELDDFRNNPNSVIVGSRLAEALER